MRGSQLAELAEDYAVVRETLDTMAATLKRKSQSLPDLQRRAKDAKERYDTLKTLDSIDERIEELSNELSWSQVIFKEKELKNAQEDVIRAEAIVHDAKAKLATAQVRRLHKARSLFFLSLGIIYIYICDDTIDRLTHYHELNRIK